VGQRCGLLHPHPFHLLWDVNESLVGSLIKWGAQMLHSAAPGVTLHVCVQVCTSMCVHEASVSLFQAGRV
jgi:hypothetical protein